jgi:ABC-type uncharacterized transport system permease subunit
MTMPAHALASLLYLVAALIGFQSQGSQRATSAVGWLLAAGVLTHAFGFASLHWEPTPIPLSSFPAAVSLIGWLVAACYLMSLGIARVRGMGVWVAAAAALFTLGAALGMLGGPSLGGAASGAGQAGAWPHAHVLLSTLGFSMLALASLGALAYLAKQRALKRKSRMRQRLPSLESLDRMQHFTLTLGFALLTLGVITGFAWGAQAQISPWTRHAVWLLVAWTVYLLPLGLRLLGHQHGERPARGLLVGFVLLAFSYIGIRLLGAGA